MALYLQLWFGMCRLIAFIFLCHTAIAADTPTLRVVQTPGGYQPLVRAEVLQQRQSILLSKRVGVPSSINHRALLGPTLFTIGNNLGVRTHERVGFYETPVWDPPGIFGVFSLGANEREEIVQDVFYRVGTLQPDGTVQILPDVEFEILSGLIQSKLHFHKLPCRTRASELSSWVAPPKKKNKR